MRRTPCADTGRQLAFEAVARDLKDKEVVEQ